MASKHSNSDKISSNGGNTALYIISSNGSKQSEEDLKNLAEICFKSNNPLALFSSANIKSKIIQDLQHESKIKLVDNGDFGDDVKNILPLKLPLSNEPEAICRWANQANKFYKGSNMVAAYGRPSVKLGYFERYIGYWSNFWPKLMTGGNSNLSSCEAVLLSPEDFNHIVLEKNISNAWQISALGEKHGNCTKVPYEYKANDFVFGDGIRAFLKSFPMGVQAIINSFFKAAEVQKEEKSKLDINHPIYKRIFGVSALLLLVTMCIISFDYNVTWDEPNHNTFSKDVLKYYTSFGNDTTMFDFQKAGHRDYYTNVFYGMSIDVLSAGINSVIGAENDFHVRHFINSLVGFLCILFAALCVRIFSGWLPAVITLIALVCSPSFFGHCFNNPKDIPFAAGYIMALYYIMKLLKELPNARHQTKVMLAIAIGFAISIRAGGLLLFLFLGMAIGLHWLFFKKKKSNLMDTIKPYFITLLVVSIAGYLIGIAMWPYALRQPLTGALTALREFEKFSFLTYYELFEGVRIFQKPWYYEPKLILLTAPLAIIGGFFIGMLLGWFKKPKLELLMFFILVFATIFPAAYAIYKESYVYNGWRHFIFIYPSLAVIAILGWYWLSSTIKNKTVQVVILGVVSLSFVKPGIWSILNHPYQYIYFNEIAGGVEGANGKYELDYWSQSPRKAFEWLVENKPEVLQGDLKVSSNNIQESLKTYVPKGKDVKYAWTREYEWADNDWSYAIWTTRTLSKNQILDGYWPPKGTIHEVKVDGVTVAAVVKSANNYSHLGRKYLKSNNGDSAVYFYKKAVEYNPLEEEYARGLADAYKISGKYDSSIAMYQKAISLRDGNYEAYQSLGMIYYSLSVQNNESNPDKEMLNKAFDNLSKAFSYKKNASAPLFLGEIMLMRNNAYEAKNYFNAFLKTYGNVGNGYLGLARSQLVLGETDSAYYNLQAAIQLDPNNPQAYYILGTELQKSGRSKDAEQFLNKYMELVGKAP
ncbi:MAG: hypothetical protein R2852_00575 [Bacteroidia bacterium]